MVPASVRYGCKVNTTLGLTTESVTVKSMRCFPVRYWAVVMVMTSGAGFTVTVKNSGAETAPAAFVATTWKLSVTLGVPNGNANVNAGPFAVAPDATCAVAAVGFGFSTVGAPLACCVNTKLTGNPFGSTALALSCTGVPENTVSGAVGFTVGAAAGLTVMVVLELFVPQAPITVSVAVTVVPVGVAGALNAGFAILAFDKLPALTAHEYVNGPSPLALPARVIVPVLATV